ALLALVRVSASCPQHAKTEVAKGPVDAELKAAIFERLLKLGAGKLSDDQRLDLLRIWEIAMNRMGPPAAELKEKLIDQLDAIYPAKARETNAELCQVLVYLEAPKVVQKTLKLLADAPTQEEQLQYGRSLRVLKKGWTLGQRKEYFRWQLKAANFKGGASMRGFLRLIR